MIARSDLGLVNQTNTGYESWASRQRKFSYKGDCCPFLPSQSSHQHIILPHIDICFRINIINMHFSLIALATPLLFAARLVAYLPSLTQLRKTILLLTEIPISVPSLDTIASVRIPTANTTITPSFAVITRDLPLTHTTMIKSTR